jgi:hypothetical protein
MIANGREMGVGKETLFACQLARKGKDITQHNNEDEMEVKSTASEGNTWQDKRYSDWRFPR